MPAEKQPNSSEDQRASRAAWISIGAGATHHITTGMIHFLPALFALHLGASPVVVGLIPAAHSFPGVLSAMPGGKFADRFGAWQVARLTTFLRTLVVLLYLMVPSPIWLTVPGFLSGALATMTVVSLHTYVSTLSRGGERRKQISRFALTASIGELVGPALAGILVDLFGFRVSFLTVAGMCFLSFLSSWCLPRVRELEKDKGSDEVAIRGFAGLLRHSGVQTALWGTVLVASLHGFLRGFLPMLLYLKNSATEIGSLYFVASLTSIVGRSAISWRSEKWRLLKVVPVAILMTATAVLILPYLSGYRSVAGVMALFGAGYGLMSVLGVVVIAEQVAPEERGLANGIRLGSMRTGATLGPLLFGPVAEFFSLALAFVGIAALGFLGGLRLLLPTFIIYGRGRDSEGIQ